MKLLTQTDIVQCIVDNWNNFPSIRNALSIPIEAIKGTYEFISISENNLLVTALDLLRTHSAVAVVNEWGEESDFHFISLFLFHSLFISIHLILTTFLLLLLSFHVNNR